MDTDQIMEYAQAVGAYKTAVAEHAEVVGEAQLEVSRAAGRIVEAETHLREVIEKLGSDPMNVLKKQRVRATDEDLDASLRPGTIAELAPHPGEEYPVVVEIVSYIVNGYVLVRTKDQSPRLAWMVEPHRLTPIQEAAA